MLESTVHHFRPQFLYDEHISSRLAKDLSYLRQHREALGRGFPLDRSHPPLAAHMAPPAVDCYL